MKRSKVIRSLRRDRKRAFLTRWLAYRIVSRHPASAWEFYWKLVQTSE